MNRLFRFRDTLALLALILISPALNLADRAHRSPPAPGSLTDTGPQPPCEQEAVPPYPRLEDPAVVKSWSESGLGNDWKPPACTGWTEPGFMTLVTTVARFREVSDAEGLLRRVGAISQLTGVRYWSTTHKRWRTLIVDAYALTALPGGQRRKDFTPR
jgi:hypothetical protein